MCNILLLFGYFKNGSNCRKFVNFYIIPCSIPAYYFWSKFKIHLIQKIFLKTTIKDHNVAWSTNLMNEVQTTVVPNHKKKPETKPD